MKTQLKLLISTISLLLLIGCTATTPQPIGSIQTHPSSTTSNSNGTLGRPIGTPPKNETTKRPVQHSSLYGTSKLSTKFTLPKSIKESSALIKLDGKLWTLNDSGGKAKLYQISERDGHIVKTVSITNARNRDWESLAYDEKYVYIGDTGNNRGNRKDLKIYKIPRGDLKSKSSVRAEVINYRYSDQKSFKSKTHKHNFDCEAMVVSNEKIYLFSKNWVDNKTRLYELSTTAGKQVAKYKSTFNINGLVTDATLNKELDILLLSTYSSLLNANVWAFTNYSGDNFFNGASKKLTFDATQTQIEGITFIDNYKAYLSSESFSKFIFTFDSTLYELDFSREFN